MLENKPLVELIYSVPFWHRVDHHYMPALTLATAYPDAPHFCMDDFAQIDPRLPQVLAEMNKRFSGNWLVMALDYWTNKKVFLPGETTKNGDRASDISVHLLIDFKYDNDAANAVEVTFSYYNFRHSSAGVSYPALTSVQTTSYPRALLDEVLPKWMQRFEMAQSLELRPKEMTKFIVNNQGVADPASLPSLDFE